MLFDCRMHGDNENHSGRWGWARRGLGGPPWMRGPFGGFGPGPRSRMFGQGDLRLLLLALIADQPSHGYDLIRTIEARFGGAYAPSPGTVYPTLTYLEEQGFIAARPEEGGKKSYEATAAGRAHLKENEALVSALMARIDVMARGAGHAPTPQRVMQAMHTLGHAVMNRFRNFSKEEEARICEIIENAARDIASGPPPKG